MNAKQSKPQRRSRLFVRARRRLLALATSAALLLSTHVAFALGPQLVLFEGFGTSEKALVSGRVVNRRRTYDPKPDASALKNLGETLNLIFARPQRDSSVEVVVNGRTFKATTDKHGYFELEIPKEALQGIKPGHHRISARLSEQRRVKARGNLQLFPKTPGTLVVSDLDDTLIDSKPTRLGQMLKRALFRNGHQMESFAGAKELFQRFSEQGLPTLYVSGSPVGLRPRLRTFLAAQGLPKGPLLLKRWGLGKDSDSPKEHREYKMRQLEKVRRYLPGYKMILLGDKGQDDAEIFHDFWSRHPASVAAAMVRRTDDSAPGEGSGFHGVSAFSHFSQAELDLERVGLLKPKARAAHARKPHKPRFGLDIARTARKGKAFWRKLEHRHRGLRPGRH
jgi:phosphatidate phosphatase APP1